MEVPVESVPCGPLSSLGFGEEDLTVLEGRADDFAERRELNRLQLRDSGDVGCVPAATELFEKAEDPVHRAALAAAGDDQRSIAGTEEAGFAFGKLGSGTFGKDASADSYCGRRGRHFV